MNGRKRTRGTSGNRRKTRRKRIESVFIETQIDTPTVVDAVEI